MGVGEDIRSMLTDVEELGNIQLSPVERLLLATDGTVTHMLEALTRGRVDVDIIGRQVRDGALDRRVVLRRGHDAQPLVWAESQVVLDRLREDVADELAHGEKGIGDLLRNEHSETHREIVTMDVDTPDSPTFPAFIEHPLDLYLRRVYTIESHGQKIITITEWFPHGQF